MKLYNLRKIKNKITIHLSDWETDELLFKNEFSKIRKGWTVVDVGSEFGYYAIMAAQLVGKIGKVIAIEPHPMNYQVLKKNLSYYKLDNVIPVRKAAGSKRETRKLYEASDLGGTSLLPPINPYIGKRTFYKWIQLVKDGSFFSLLRQYITTSSSSYYVLVDTLENILKECGVDKVDLIKIDVEGFELEVLKGSLRILESHKPTLLIEVHRQELGQKSQVVYELLNQYGYDLFCEHRPMKTLVIARAPKSGNIFWDD